MQLKCRVNPSSTIALHTCPIEGTQPSFASHALKLVLHTPSFYCKIQNVSIQKALSQNSKYNKYKITAEVMSSDPPACIHFMGSTNMEEQSGGSFAKVSPFLFFHLKHFSPSPRSWGTTCSCEATILRHFLHLYMIWVFGFDLILELSAASISLYFYILTVNGTKIT